MKQLKETGMTMVSLVVTIIILIILAGISINMTIGEDGIITKAKQAKQNIVLAGEAEAMQLNQLYYELETGGELSEDEESTKKDEIIALLQKQVEELQKQVVSLQTENAELKKQIEDLNVQIANLQKEIEDLKAQIASKDIEIAELKKQVSEKEAKIQDLQNQLNTINSLLAQTNATADKILAGYKAYSGGKLVTGTLPNLSHYGNGGNAQTYLNSTYTNVGVTNYAGAHWYTVNGDGVKRLCLQAPYGAFGGVGGHNLGGDGYIGISEKDLQNVLGVTEVKVAKGQNIAGVTGTYTSDATANANNLSSGKTAYVNGQKITGNGTDVNNSYNNGYNAGYAAGNNAGKSALKSATYSFNDRLNGNKTVSYNTGKQLVAVMLKTCSYNVYGWQQNYNAYVGAGVSCSFSGTTLSVTFPGSHTDDTNTGGGKRNSSFTVEYFYFE